MVGRLRLYLRDILADFSRDFPHWKQTTAAILGIVCVAVGIGHLLDWFSDHRPTDLKIGVGFLVGFSFLALAVRRRFEFLLTILLSLTAIGIFNAFMSQ